MNHRHNQISPFNTSFVNSTRFPSRRPPIYGGGMRRPRGRPIFPPVLPYPQTPQTRPPTEFPMYQPSRSFHPPPPLSPAAPSWSPYYPPVEPKYNEALPPLPFMRPTTSVHSCGCIRPRYAHRSGNTDDNLSGVSSLRRAPPQSAGGMIYREPVEIPPNDGTNVLLTDYVDPDEIFYNKNELEIIFKDSGNENRRKATSRDKRILADEESYGRSNAKKARRSENLDENEQTKQLTGEDPQLNLATGDVFSNDSLANLELLDPSTLQKLNEIEELLQADFDFNEHVI